MDRTVSRSVKLTEINTLPDTQKTAAIFNDTGQGRGEERGLQVTVTVAFTVTISVFVTGYHFIDLVCQVMPYIRVGVFVYRDPRSGMGSKDTNKAGGAIAFPDAGIDLGRDIDKACA
jgi:hypothetical protein